MFVEASAPRESVRAAPTHGHPAHGHPTPKPHLVGEGVSTDVGGSSACDIFFFHSGAFILARRGAPDPSGYVPGKNDHFRGLLKAMLEFVIPRNFIKHMIFYRIKVGIHWLM